MTIMPSLGIHCPAARAVTWPVGVIAVTTPTARPWRLLWPSRRDKWYKRLAMGI
jgi:hypothetical protein